MRTLIRSAHRALTITARCMLSSEQKNVPSVPEVPETPTKFLPYVYGLPLEMHVLPQTRARPIPLRPEQYELYKQKSPNYLVVLIRKVIDEGAQLSNPEQAQPADEFYKVATYCHVKYLQKNQILLRGITKVKILDLQKLEHDGSLKEPSKELQGKENKEMQIIKEDEQSQQEFKTGQQLQGNESVADPKSVRRVQDLGKSKIEPYYSLKVQKIEEPPLIMTDRLQLKFKYVLDCFVKMTTKPSNFQSLMFNSKDIYPSLDDIAGHCLQLNRKKEDIQRYLQTADVEERIEILIKMIQKNRHITHHLTQIENQAKNSIRSKKFYEYYSEMMKIAKQKIDGKKTKQLFIEKCTKSFESMNPPKEIVEIFNNEIQRYQHLDQNSMEAGIVKNYIEELSKIPYDVKSDEIFDLDFAQKVMDEQHHGMKEVKDAILQVIAVGKLKKSLKGKIFCFIGGPGLGKTSFARSVAKALNRKFYNISLGGVTDSSVLKGHRRTYVGAYSGKIIEALKNCGTSNPVILLDEIDKMGSSYHGDPRSELLQILDPNQNNSFVDNFVDVPVDLSNVLFITSANYERNISKPLLDRMEKIYLTSYTKNEKIQIFNKHLLRRAIDKTGVEPAQFNLPAQVIETLVQEYSLGEPGVRYLQKHALSLLEKVAYKMLTKQEQVPIQISKQNLRNYLGNSYYRRKDHHKIGVGVAISLGGGDYGSRLTYIEAFKKSYVSRKEIPRGTLFTGSLGDIFKQAMNISYTYARNFLLENYNSRYLYENEVHVHAPEGAFKKDGSTDSMTIVASLVSLALKSKVRPEVALTGEITLNGHVLRTHGIKQKVMVAKRQRIKDVILPKDNQPDVENLPKDITEGINFHYVNHFSEAFTHLFPDKVNNPTAEAQAKTEASQSK